MNTLFTIGEAAEQCGLHPETLKRYEQSGYIIPHYTKGGHRRYSTESLKELMNNAEVKLKNERLDKCKQLWEKTKELDDIAIIPKSKDMVKEYKAGVADFIIPILIGEILYYKETLEKLMYLQNEIRRLDRIIEAEEKFEEFEQKQKLLIRPNRVKHLPTSEIHIGIKGGITGCGFDTNIYANYWEETSDELTCAKNGCKE